MTGDDVPDEGSADHAVFLPGRNPLLLIKPAVWCQMHGVAQLAVATLSNNPFADARPEFFDHFTAMLKQALGESAAVIRPFEKLTKREVMRLGRSLPLGLTFSCLAPVAGAHCGRCNKCAERRRAFALAEMRDPTRYAETVTP
jgi:7-cyano-7-deazaguanine synthase